MFANGPDLELTSWTHFCESHFALLAVPRHGVIEFHPSDSDSDSMEWPR
jgi:hypothetical protein